jgi:hypothetical protein
MTQRSPFDRAIAFVTVVSLHLLFLPAFGAETASLRGHVFDSNAGSAPLSGARVHVGDPESGRFYRSGWTDGEGGFTLDGLPAAEYRVAVESEGGLYVVGTPVRLAPGQARSLQLAINPQTGPPTTQENDDDRGGGGFWRNPLTATLTVLGIAVALGFLIDELDDDDDDDGSPTNP